MLMIQLDISLIEGHDMLSHRDHSEACTDFSNEEELSNMCRFLMHA